ncbi:hypothetical protein [Pseudactinotalea suaedae]|uniref:hypothetical protein n=1 Tax=Pseudactinotalea suaedae TaxID=1524924 RepID=UPI0012E238ED|nr:hypothetical protein [Pseudactinotalea suaedae]
MARYVIDADVAIRLAREGLRPDRQHQLVAPNLLRSQVLSQMYRAVRAGKVEEAEARAVLDHVTTMKMRLLGDRVSRATAWKIAAELGWDDTPLAEYLAVTRLQADAFVTLDGDLARSLSGVVPIAAYEALSRS